MVLPEVEAIPFLSTYPKEASTYHNNTCSTIFIAVSFVILRSWGQPSCSSAEEWIQKMCCIYTMEYYSAIKNEDIMILVGKWMELENIIPCEDILDHKYIHGIYSLISGY